MQERSFKILETIKLGAYQPTCMMQLGEAYLLAGRIEDALQLARRPRPSPGSAASGPTKHGASGFSAR